MDRRKSLVLVAFFVFLICMDAVLADGQGNGNGNGKGNGNDGKGPGDGKGEVDNGKGPGDGKGEGDNGKGPGDGKGEGDNGKGPGDGKGQGDNDQGNDGKPGKGDDKKDKKEDPAATKYRMLTKLPTGQEQAFCEATGPCNYKTLTCPAQCPSRKPKKNKESKGCFIDCSAKCEATCKWRKPNCNGYGSLCYDPRFVGGDGVMFYFHGSKGGNFAIVSDDNLQINAHFIGTRPAGRSRDFTWVQALSVMFDTHNLVIAAKRVSKWDDKVDALIIRWDGEDVTIPSDEESEWRANSEEREVVVERTDETNTIRATVSGLAQLDIKVRPIGKEENRVHNYQLPEDNAFAHLETQFKFFNLSDLVEGVLGTTYRPDYVSPVKIGVPMPMMGGEDKYQTPSLYSPVCKFCRFKARPVHTDI